MNSKQLMKRCQMGCNNLDDANNLLAECYGHIGMLRNQKMTLIGNLTNAINHLTNAKRHCIRGLDEPIETMNKAIYESMKNE